MKKLIAIVIVSILLSLGIFNFVDAATRVRGYYQKSGTYVQPYYRSNSNSSRWDNWSTKGNYNPYTGKKGYTNPYRYYRW